MGGERDMTDETRNQMMQNLFGEQSEDEEEEEEVNSVHEAAANHSDYESVYLSFVQPTTKKEKENTVELFVPRCPNL